MKFFIQLTAAIILAAPFASSSTMQTPTQALESIAKQIVTQLVAHQFKDVELRFDDRMRAALPQEKLSAVWDSLIGQTGPFQRILHTQVGEQKGMQVVNVTCEFQHASLDAKIVLDQQGRVTGLFFAPAAAPQTEESTWSAPSYANQAEFHERDVIVGSGQWKLPGTLTLPNGKGPFPAVVLVQGSGPHDQDETIGPNRPFKDLAWGLASQKIAVLRYVKRTKKYGAQSSATAAFTVNVETVDDADAAVSLLAGEPEIDHNHIYVLGHSLGGMLAPRIAMNDKQVAGIIIAAGTARPLEQVVVQQLKYLATQGKVSEKQIDDAERAQAEIESPSLKPDATVVLLGATIPASYFLDLRNYYPAEAAATLKVPILVLQGGRDYQVTSQDYEIWKAALAKDPRASFKFYPSLMHLFMPGTGSGPGSPADYEVPGHVAHEAIEDIAQWIKRNSAAK
ncbi:MAG: alpha/beta fold hydrolase [Acidobacteriaceae bacterium]